MVGLALYLLLSRSGPLGSRVAVHDVAAGEAWRAEETETQCQDGGVIRVFIMAGSPFASAAADAMDNAEPTG